MNNAGVTPNLAGLSVGRWTARSKREAASRQLATPLWNPSVPEVSRFFGIVITMYDDEHPPPHFYARYAGKSITVHITDGAVTGKLPPRALGLVLEWWTLHQAELILRPEFVTVARAGRRR